MIFNNMKKLLFILLFFPSILFAQAAKDTSSEKMYLTWARDAWKNKDYKTCIEDYTALIDIDPKKALYYVNRATAKWDLKNYDEAIEDFKLAISLDDKYAWIYYNDIGLLKMSELDFKGAITAYTKSIELYSSGSTYHNRALAELANEDYNISISDFTVAINRDNNNPKFRSSSSYYLVAGNQYYSRGKAKLLNGDTQKAISDLDSAITINPKLALAYNTRGEAKNKLGNKAGACADWQTASDMDCEPARENLKKYCGAN